MNSRRQQQQHQQPIFSNEHLTKIKHTWYHQTPSSLYSLCIDTIVRNINVFLVKKSNQQQQQHNKRLKYGLADQISILPNCVCQSILKSYAQFYLDQLSKLERNEFFQIKKNDIDSQMQTDSLNVPNERINLITYYDLLLAFASRPEKIYLNQIEYRQCMWSSSTLEQRLRTRLQNDLLANDSSIQQINTNYFRLYSASSLSENKFVLKSVRAQQQPHLEDKQLKLILKNQSKRCQYLDLCPCLLTNKSIHLINKYVKNLKYLRLQNCCDWSQRTNQNNLDMNEDDEDDDDEEEESDLEDDLKSYLEAFFANYVVANKEYRGDFIPEENEDDDDAGEFDAYLEEYLNRYETNNERENEEDIDMETEHKNKRRRHHHHHKHSHHHHHHHRRRHKRNRAQNHDDDEMLSADLELFLMSNNLSHQHSSTTRRQNHHDRFIRSQLHQSTKKRKELTKCKLFKLNKQARMCRKSLRNKLNQILNTKTPLSTETSKAKTSSQAVKECDKEANSLIKWLVQNTVKNTSEATTTSAPTSSSSMSLIEQIRQRAALLAETKMIDKVSISSSNYDDNDLNKKSLEDDDDDDDEDENNNLEENSNSNPYLETSSSSNSYENHQSTGSSVYLSYDDENNEDDDDKTDKIDLNKSSSSSSCTSCSSNSSSQSSSSTDYSDTDDKLFSNSNEPNSNPRFIRQQHLLDKVANLGSSPINMIQSIAAKALKFKLKNSVSFAELAAQLSEEQREQLLDKPTSSSDSNTSASAATSSKTSKLTTKYNRLLRQYKFFKSTHISSPNKATTSKAASQDDFYLNTTSQQEKSTQSNSNLFSVFKYWMSNKRAPTNTKTNLKEEEEEEAYSSTSSSSSSTSSLNHKSSNSKLEMLLLLLMNNNKHSTNSKKFEKNLTTFTKSLQVEALNLKNLQHLSLRNLGTNVIDIKLLNSLLKNLTNLKLLDISNCCTGQLFKQDETTNSQIGLLDALVALKSTLTHLIMADLNVEDVQTNFKYILKMKQLKHLDVSNCREKPPVNAYKNPSVQLAKLVYHLTNLIHLDISGTNLGGTSIFKEQDEIDYIKKKLYEDLIDEFNDYQRVKLDEIKTIKSDVVGLMFLNNESKMLDFFGCFSCDNSVSSRARIPAIRIAGEDCEKNLYTSLEAYANERPLFVLDALNHLFEAYRDELVEEKLFGGHLIMNTMEKNLDNSKIQISGSASLFYVLKYWKEENAQLPPFYLKRLIQTVINGMEEHIDEPAMRRNCVLIMCRLNLPDDVLFVSDRLIKILLKIFDDYIEDRNKNPSNDRQEHFVLRTAMHLLNILACSVHGSDKSQVGSQAIPIAMNLIKTKTKFKEADDILEVTWSFLWNITDETPENCKIFLDLCDGMSAFMECIQFKKAEITRNMMGLLGNVAEVKSLRNRLCKNDYISTFRQLLFYSNDGIEIPYNSAGVLVHIMSDGLDAWATNECSDHERQTVIEDIETAIDKWDLQSERNINYRSFEPIFRLVNQYESPICQRWSCWALANLTTVYPDVYCPLFEKENGRQVLEKILSNDKVNDAIKNFSRIVLRNVDKKLNTTSSTLTD